MKSVEFAAVVQTVIKLLENRIHSLGLVLGQDAALVVDDDFRALLKAGSRAKKLLEDCVSAIAKFDEKFEAADAKSPRKILLAKIESDLRSWAGDPDETAAAISALIGKKTAGNATPKPGKKSEENPTTLLQKSDANSGISGLTETSKSGTQIVEIPAAVSAAQSRARAARAATPRRQKMVDPLAAEAKQFGAPQLDAIPNPATADRRSTGAEVEERGDPKRG